ncbi:MAG: LysR family transcriptional regulator [Pseudomonadota bacterium]
MDRYEDMRCFVQVAELQSVTRAAEALSLAPSAVSRRIKDLESRLGAQLFSRTTRRMSLTEAGRVYFQSCQRILGDIEEAESAVSGVGGHISGQLRVAAPLSFGLSHLTPALCRFVEAHPELRVDLDLSDRMVDLVGEGFDLALRIGTLRDSSLIARKLCDVRMICCASPCFLAEHGTPERPTDLSTLPCLCYSGSERADIWRWRDEDGAEQSVQVPMRIRATNGDMMRDAAIAGLGMVLKPSFIVHQALAEGTLVPVLKTVDWVGVTIYLVYPETRHLAAKTRAFIDHMRSHIGPKPYWEADLDV